MKKLLLLVTSFAWLLAGSGHKRYVSLEIEMALIADPAGNPQWKAVGSLLWGGKEIYLQYVEDRPTARILSENGAAELLPDAEAAKLAEVFTALEDLTR